MKAKEEKGHPKEEIDAFKKGAPAALKRILEKYDDFDFFMGESMEEGSMYVLINYRDDGVTPYATIWKYGLEEMKV